MITPRNSRQVLVISIVALLMTLIGASAAGYAILSTRATRWGDSLVIGPGFTGEVILDGHAAHIRVEREDGIPVLDAPAWKGRGPFYVTFLWGFAVYHTPPGTLDGGAAPAGGVAGR